MKYSFHALICEPLISLIKPYIKVRKCKSEKLLNFLRIFGMLKVQHHTLNVFTISHIKQKQPPRQFSKISILFFQEGATFL